MPLNVLGPKSPNGSVAVGERAVQGLTTVAQRLSPSGRQTQAGQLLQAFLEAGQTDPEAVMKLLADGRAIADTIPGFRGTAAMTTGEQRLLQLEAELAEQERGFAVESRRRAEDSLKAISNAIALLRGTGDPEALKVAAQLRRDRYQMMMHRVMAVAEEEAVERIQAIGADVTTAERTRLSREVALAVYDRAMTRARDVEATLWDEALPDEGAPATFRSIQQMLGRIKGETSVIELPKNVVDRLDQIGAARQLLRRVELGQDELPDGTKITKAMVEAAERLNSVGELKRFRSDMLALARGQGRSTQETADRFARWYGLLAEAALDDMVRAGVATRATEFGARRGAGGQFTSDMTPLDIAREYSKAFNDTFTRGFVGAGQRQGGYGLAVPPESLLHRAFASGDHVGDLQLRELREAVEFLPARTYGNPAQLADIDADIDLVVDAQGRYLRLMAQRVVQTTYDPDLGRDVQRVSLPRARKFLEQSVELLERFPEVRADLEAAVESQRTLDNWYRRVRGTERRLDRDSAIGRVLKMDSPADAIRGAFNGPQPQQQFEAFARLAAGAGPDAVQGLRAATFDFVIRNATSGDGNVSLPRLLQSLYGPVRPGLPSLVEMMQANGVIDAKGVSRLQELAEAAGRVLQAGATLPTGEEVVGGADLITDIIIRLVGSEAARAGLAAGQTVAGVSSAGATGSTLIAAGRGSQAAQQFLNRVPTRRLKDLLVDALRGAEVRAGAGEWSLLETLLSSEGGRREAFQRTLLLHGYAWQAGILGIEDEAMTEDRDRVDADDGALPPGLSRVD